MRSPPDLGPRSRRPLSPAAPSAPPEVGRTLVEQLWGRLGQIDATPEGGQSTLAVALVAEAQRARRPVAWIQPAGGPLYPPDLAAAGVDLAALAVLHVGDGAQVAGRLRAAEWLLMRGAFGLVVVDANAALPKGDAWQGRLLRHVREFRSSVVVLCRRAAGEPSLGALMSLRLAAAPRAATSGPRLLTAEPADAPAADVRGMGMLPPSAFDLAVSVRKCKAAILRDELPLVRRGPSGL